MKSEFSIFLLFGFYPGKWNEKKKHLLLPLVSFFPGIEQKQENQECVRYLRGNFSARLLIDAGFIYYYFSSFSFTLRTFRISPLPVLSKKIKKQTPEDACSSAQLIFFFFILPQTPFVLIHLPTSLKHSLRYLYKRHFVATSCWNE